VDLSENYDDVREDDPMTLSEFLLARIAEDEAAARECMGVPVHVLHGASRGVAEFLGFGPTFILAECEARRRIVERYAHVLERGDSGDARWVLPLLALPYAGRPDYQQEWKP